jgi:hypothetical protein
MECRTTQQIKMIAKQGGSATKNPYQKTESLQLRVSSSDILIQGAGSFSKPEVAGQTTKNRDSPAVRNLPSSSTRVTSLEASSSGIPTQEAGSSSKPVEKGDLQKYAGFT